MERMALTILINSKIMFKRESGKDQLHFKNWEINMKLIFFIRDS